MKKNLLLKLNDVLNINNCQSMAIKKSIEFFIGRMVGDSELRQHFKSVPLSAPADSINAFLTNKGIFLREAALIKKYGEYFRGREYDGLIIEVKLLPNKKKFDLMAKKHNVMILSHLPDEDNNFLANMLKINALLLSAKTLEKGIEKAKKQSKEKLTLVGSTEKDMEIAGNSQISFIGLKMETKNTIEKIEDLF
ncbi:hypothetical protein GOV09_02140 [Candidatus Woesearchaeota archaeon]|nr:hypothetical protein [Candidatus Woesearchaeota archaeon]